MSIIPYLPDVGHAWPSQHFYRPTHICRTSWNPNLSQYISVGNIKAKSIPSFSAFFLHIWEHFLKQVYIEELPYLIFPTVWKCRWTCIFSGWFCFLPSYLRACLCLKKKTPFPTLCFRGFNHGGITDHQSLRCVGGRALDLSPINDKKRAMKGKERHAQVVAALSGHPGRNRTWINAVNVSLDADLGSSQQADGRIISALRRISGQRGQGQFKGLARRTANRSRVSQRPCADQIKTWMKRALHVPLQLQRISWLHNSSVHTMGNRIMWSHTQTQHCTSGSFTPAQLTWRRHCSFFSGSGGSCCGGLPWFSSDWGADPMKADVWAVCWSGAFRRVLTQSQEGKTQAMNLTLAPI